MTEPQTRTAATKGASWHEIVLASLKANNVKLVIYVPDRVFTPLIKAIHADPFFTTFAATREEEAIGIVTGAWMGGMRAAVLMQTSGFATIPNALASLVVPSQIPALIFVSERGTLGEFNLGQAMVYKTMRPVLDSLGIETTPLRILTSSPSLSTARSSRLWRRWRRLLSSSRRCLPAAKCSRLEREHADERP